MFWHEFYKNSMRVLHVSIIRTCPAIIIFELRVRAVAVSGSFFWIADNEWCRGMPTPGAAAGTCNLYSISRILDHVMITVVA